MSIQELCPECGQPDNCGGCNHTPAACANILDLRRPVRSERHRGFQPPWYTVYVYRCACGNEVRMRASSFRGTTPEPAVGGIVCGAKLGS